MVKRLPAMWETRVQSLGWEDPLEKEMATHSSILAWRIPRAEEHGRLQSMGSQSRTQLSNFTHFTSLLMGFSLIFRVLCFTFQQVWSLEKLQHTELFEPVCVSTPMTITWTQDSAPGSSSGPLASSWICFLCSAHCARTPPLWPQSLLQLHSCRVLWGECRPAVGPQFSVLVKGPGPFPHMIICSWNSLLPQTYLVSRELYEITSQQQQQRLGMPSEITAGVDSVPRRDAHVHSCLMDTGRRFSLLTLVSLFILR